MPLKASGTTYTGAAIPFITGIKNPLPVLATPGGALLIGDWSTGTIYKITAAAG